ncbi:hypothetical protein QR680_012352 [Steinernema hermaphroditum]|uniref:PSI domain-containing protein n=1 Tax=Steinernema hermaphroditum TaxID=289476 RepID=A0AA39I428_9BILA|nr:hypothetical protein QR680_012352 [Steinernema hermaphroditum]
MPFRLFVLIAESTPSAKTTSSFDLVASRVDVHSIRSRIDMTTSKAALFFVLFVASFAATHAYEAFDYRVDSADGTIVNLRHRREAVEESKTEEEDDKPDMGEDSDVEKLWKIPDDISVDGGFGDDDQKTDLTYYHYVTYNSSADFQKHYQNVTAMLEGGAKGKVKHPMLHSSYRKAAAAALRFRFPFYGHYLQHLTLTTGGFCYVGDESHSWLAATQYIAPLMSNFESNHNDSTIQYADDGQKFVVEWLNVRLRDNPDAGRFTFQTVIHANGDIWFVYKSIPIPVGNISTHHHPRKVGVSDAYLFNQKLISDDGKPTTKRVIFEYHRINVPDTAVRNGSVVVLLAQPTCIQFGSCSECAQSSLKHFNCSWCHRKDAQPFCSDQQGMNRRRQDWVEGDCVNQGFNIYCDGSTPASNLSSAEPTTAPNPTPKLKPDRVVPLELHTTQKPAASSAGAQKEETTSGSGFASIFSVLLVLAAGTSIWLVYAYYNPHSASGQLLIKYRPTKWLSPNSHVRYSASLHI